LNKQIPARSAASTLSTNHMSTIIGGENEAITHGCRIYLLITENEMDAMGGLLQKNLYQLDESSKAEE